MERVYQGIGPVDAYMVRDWLDRNGITAWVHGQHLMGACGELPVSWPSVWVAKDDEPRARAAVTAYEQPKLVHPDWLCRCGETNGPAFGACWSCGAEPG